MLTVEKNPFLVFYYCTYGYVKIIFKNRIKDTSWRRRERMIGFEVLNLNKSVWIKKFHGLASRKFESKNKKRVLRMNGC